VLFSRKRLFLRPRRDFEIADFEILELLLPDWFHAADTARRWKILFEIADLGLLILRLLFLGFLDVGICANAEIMLV